MSFLQPGAPVSHTTPPKSQSSHYPCLKFLDKWVFPKIGVPPNGWFIMENPVKMDDLGVELSETSKCWKPKRNWPNKMSWSYCWCFRNSAKKTVEHPGSLKIPIFHKGFINNKVLGWIAEPSTMVSNLLLSFEKNASLGSWGELVANVGRECDLAMKKAQIMCELTIPKRSPAELLGSPSLTWNLKNDAFQVRFISSFWCHFQLKHVKLWEGKVPATTIFPAWQLAMATKIGTWPRQGRASSQH